MLAGDLRMRWQRGCGIHGADYDEAFHCLLLIHVLRGLKLALCWRLEGGQDCQNPESPSLPFMVIAKRSLIPRPRWLPIVNNSTNAFILGRIRTIQ